MSIIKPFTPINVSEDKNIRAEVVMRSITFGDDSLPISIIADGEELLSAPMRIVGTEDEKEMKWTVKDSFIFSRSEEELTVCGSMQSEQFIINTCFKLSYDGCMQTDIKLMPRGMTVAQAYGMEEIKKPGYRIGKLILEIPLRKSAELYHMFPNGKIIDGDGEVTVPFSMTSCSGELPKSVSWLPFRPILWFGNEKRGLCIFSESDENMQPRDVYHVNEIIDVENSDTRLLRIHLLDSHPKKWGAVPTGKAPNYVYTPLSFSLGFEATPIKPFPKNPALHNALHIDCFKKIEGDYAPYLAGDFGGENGYDRMKRLGVSTLILHEKWNKMQNFPYLSEPTANRLKEIISQCHRRGIKVIPYFGYELSSLSPLWSETRDEALRREPDGSIGGGWWRVPPQRDYILCYKSSFKDIFVEGIRSLIEEYHFDGIYLDTTLNAGGCTNELHGCGYIDSEGKRKPTYPILAIRDLLRRLYEIVEPLGGIINYHSYACCNIPAMGFTHLGWNGESIQLKLLNEGAKSLPLDYFRAEYMGRNFGIPQELIAYENRPKWTFEQATAFSVIHGILPRPNNIEGPLEFMSEIWKIFDKFPIDKSEWILYNENDEITTGNDAVKCSFYRYRDICGRDQYLIMAANVESEPAEFKFSCDARLLFGTAEGDNKLPPFGFGIYFAEKSS